MTMCVLWKDKAGSIHVGTDSRLNFGASTFDYCVKISRMTCHLHEPGSVGKESVLIKSVELTIAFCGGFSSAYTVKESLCEILNCIIAAPDTNHVSMKSIADIAFQVYKNVTAAILETLMKLEFTCIFYLIGRCPKDKVMKCYKFSCDYNDSRDGFEYFNTEMFINKTFEISGSGRRHLESKHTFNEYITQAYQKNNMTYLLDILKEVIDDSSCDTVDGAIQYAKCSTVETKFYSMITGEGNGIKYMKAGIDLNSLNDELLKDNMFIEVNAITKQH